MAIRVKAPDGSIVEFPDGMNDDQIALVMRREFGGPKSATNKGADVGRGYVSGLLEGAAGLADVVWGASPLGATSNALRAGASAASAMSGKRTQGSNAPFAGVSRAVAPMSYEAKTSEGRIAKTAGQMSVNALVPSSLGARVANVVVPTVTAEGAASFAKGAGVGKRGQELARGLGGAAGGFLASVRAAPGGSRTVNALTGRGKVDGATATAKAEELRAAGVRPTLNDVVGESGRRLVRAVGVKSPEAGEVLQGNARQAVTTTKPAVMARTREVGPNRGMSADEMVENLLKTRDEAATANYAEPYDTPVPLTDDVMRALSDAPGKAALQRARAAAVARMDDARVSEIDRLLKASTGPQQPVAAATLDRTRKAMAERSQTAAQRGSRELASGYNARVGMLDETLDKVPGLQDARADYKAKSQAIDVLGRGREDVFSTDPADYAKWLEGLAPEAREANKVAIRQEVLDTLGGQRSSTMGSVEELTQSQYAKQNLATALGEEAGPYLRNLEAQLEQLRNSQFVAPNNGSRTAVLENDTGKLEGMLSATGDVVTRNYGRMSARVMDWLRTRGLNDKDALQLAQDAVDPAKLDSVLQALAGRVGNNDARQFLQLRNAAMAAVTGGAVSSAPGTTSARARD